MPIEGAEMGTQTEAVAPRRWRPLLRNETVAGAALFLAAIAALVIANGPLAPAYQHGLETRIGALTVHHWIDDALMALFFLLIALDVKREMVTGSLSSWRRRVLPGAAAFAGMAVPALIFVGLNLSEPAHLRGWAIPAATDIAFALPVLALIGARAAPELRGLLTAIAVIDDLLAILVIAVFYTADLAFLPLLGALAGFGVLLAMNRAGVRSLIPYLAIGIGIWLGIYASGVHATLAGVLVAFAIPLDRRGTENIAPLQRLEHGLQPWVGLLILPVFGFANAGIALGTLTLGDMLSPLPLGIALALFLGKQAGIMGAIWTLVRTGIAQAPDVGWRQLYGLSLLCGIGFTISIFISGLAFEGSPILLAEAKLGVFIGSLFSGVVAAVVLAGVGWQSSLPSQSSVTTERL